MIVMLSRHRPYLADGHRLAREALAAWSAVTIGALVFALISTGVFQYTGDNDLSMLVAFVLSLPLAVVVLWRVSGRPIHVSARHQSVAAPVIPSTPEPSTVASVREDMNTIHLLRAAAVGLLAIWGLFYSLKSWDTSLPNQWVAAGMIATIAYLGGFLAARLVRTPSETP